MCFLNIYYVKFILGLGDMGRITSLKSLIIAFGIAMAGSAGAATLGVDECIVSGGKGKSGATFTLDPSSKAECFAGDNDANTIDATTTVLGSSGWSLKTKLDSSGGAAGDDFNFDTGLIAHDDSKSGSIFGDLSTYEFAFIVLKAGNGFGAFLVSVLDDEWDWTATKGISHVSLWTKGTVTPGLILRPK